MRSTCKRKYRRVRHAPRCPFARNRDEKSSVARNGPRRFSSGRACPPELTGKPAEHAENDERVQRVEGATPAPAPRERSLDEDQEREQDRRAAQTPVGVPRQQRED